MAETVQNVSIARETHNRYLTYALSVITARALPDVRDGLKPVQRRILYTMYRKLRLAAAGKPRKCAKIVGEVMGNFHPHGDMAIYEALVRLAQPFMMRLPLVEGQGNFGSVDGDAAAAYRYTEAKLTEAAERLMTELGQQTTEFRPNFDSTDEEPVTLPAQYPNLLVNGASGIAVGLATNIPPHNLSDVIKTAVELIDNPDATTSQLVTKLKGPDFPLGGRLVTDRNALIQIYEEGRGTVKLQAEWKLEEVDRTRQIVITSIPYAVAKNGIEEAIGDIVANRKLPQVTGIIDESNEANGIRIVLTLDPKADPETVMAYLYKHTNLQSNFSFNMTCLVPSGTGELKPERLGLKPILRHFLDFRFVTVERRYQYRLGQLRERLHILEGFVKIFKDLDRALELIRKSKGKEDAEHKLMAAFKLSERQARAIVELQLYRLAQMEVKKIQAELKEKALEAKEIEAILASEERIWNVIRDELNDIAKTYGERRRTRIGRAEDLLEFDPEAYITRENTNVILTRDGWIKRVNKLTSLEVTRVREGDAVIAVAPGSTQDHVIFFADDGTAFTMRINDVPLTSGYGEPITKFFRLNDQTRIITLVSTDERFLPRASGTDGPSFFTLTEQGMTMRAPLEPFLKASTKTGRRYVRLGERDRVVAAKIWSGEKSAMVATEQGRVLHFPMKDVSILVRPGKGDVAIQVAKDDRCLGGGLISGPRDGITIDTSGDKTKKLGFNQIKLSARGGTGEQVIKRHRITQVVPDPIALVDWSQFEENAASAKKKS